MPGNLREMGQIDVRVREFAAQGLDGTAGLYAAYPFGAPRKYNRGHAVFGFIGIPIAPGRPLWEFVQQHGAQVIKAQFAVWARLYQKGNPEPDNFVTIDINEFCDDIGFRRHKRAHTRENKQRALDLLTLLTTTEIHFIYDTGKCFQRLRGRLFESGITAENLEYGDLFGANLVGDEKLWDPCYVSFRPGAWFADEEWQKYNWQIVVLGKGILSLDSGRNDRWAVIVGAYIVSLCRMNGLRPLRCKVDTLVRVTGLFSIYARRREKKRMQELLDKALDRLRQVNVIQSYELTSASLEAGDNYEFAELDKLGHDGSKKVEACPISLWDEDWLSQIITITWPESIQAQARALEGYKGKRLKAERRRRTGNDPGRKF